MCGNPHNNLAVSAKNRIALKMAVANLSRKSLRLILAGIVSIAIASTAFMLVDRTMRARALVEEEQAALDKAAILSASLRSELDKFSLLPMALAQDPQVRALLLGNRDAARQLNVRLQALAERSGAAAIYVMDADGLTMSASNWNQQDSFVGSNYAFRRYFEIALSEGTATQFALGTVSRKPGLYIASRIDAAQGPAGVVALKVEFDATEQRWRETTDGVYVTDAEGVVLLTSAEEWRFHIAEGEETGQRDPDRDQSQFGIARLPALVIRPADTVGEIVELPLLDARQTLTPDGWVLHMLADPGPRVRANLATGRLVLVLLMAAIAIVLLMAWIMRRRRRTQEELLVSARTRTLREQLSQANRLATLGQISAGVNHEIGQPVTALRVYAETGEKLVQAGKIDAAAENFRQIVSLADRIGRITSELRLFSRRQPGDTRPVPVGEVIEGAQLLLRDRLHSEGIRIILPDETLRDTIVKAEHVRLEQVLVNLLQNAIDASPKNGLIKVEIDTPEKFVALRVIDAGEGISTEVAAQLFQPFVTSKASGLGLGLVISRDIMRDIGGDLVLEADREGTCFTMKIPRA